MGGKAQWYEVPRCSLILTIAERIVYKNIHFSRFRRDLPIILQISSKLVCTSSWMFWSQQNMILINLIFFIYNKFQYKRKNKFIWKNIVFQLNIKLERLNTVKSCFLRQKWWQLYNQREGGSSKGDIMIWHKLYLINWWPRIILKLESAVPNIFFLLKICIRLFNYKTIRRRKFQILTRSVSEKREKSCKICQQIFFRWWLCISSDCCFVDISSLIISHFLTK